MSDQQNFTGTRPVSAQHEVDLAVLQVWLQANVPGFAGPLQVEMFKGGQSNPTYKLLTPQRQYVMRAKPGPMAKLLPSAHAIEREFKVMGALHGTDVPVARMFLDLGMHRGPLLAYLMADPELSLQSILMVAVVIGRPKTFSYVALVALFSVVAGLLYGAWVDGVNPGWIAAGLLAFMGVLAALFRWMLGRRAGLARA